VSGHILAIGGGGVSTRLSKLEELLLELAGVGAPRVCFLPTAAETTESGSSASTTPSRPRTASRVT
jgi:hypothetical protein